ncbi:hypothetical protein PVIIG_06041 [Plasmodium vivax India VII]|uniref:VIR protein n=1 Tax=Plasmodium vivax India VII TaxID=1077284 RepID=A0A0J9S1Y7_PLAVI|nr:hypothetical protein PVIIG_06041 [Plasmodium vivax India VII]
MASTTEPDPGYLFYRKYTALKNEFKRKVNLNYTPSYWDECLKHVNTISNEKLPYKQKIFKDLINHLSQFTIFNSHQASDCCKYINFWLNDEISKSYSDVSSLEFSIFIKFAQKYAELQYNNKHYSCEPYLIYLDPDIYIKMKLLYDFYHNYDEIKSPPTNQESKACDTLSNLLRLYNDGIKKYFEQDPRLFERLKDLKNLIKELKVESINGCRWILSKFKEPDVELEIQKQQLSKKAEMVTQETLSQEKSVRALDIAQTQLQQEVTKSPQVQEETISVETHTEYDNHRESTNHHARHNHRTEMDSINEISPPHEAPHVGLFPKRPQLQLKGQEYVQPPEFSNDVAKDSSTILSSITGFINEVEPAPILGVSGGMGALFLLFKVL